MFLRKNVSVPGLQVLAPCGLGVLFLLAIVLRIALYPVETSDYMAFLSQWYSFIASHGGFAALKYNFSNYNTPYLYLLTLATYLPIPELIAIKTISVMFDGVLGLFAYLILSLRFRRSYATIIGVLVILFAPTIFINSAAWGQADATYTAFCLGSLYFLFKDRLGWACVFFGLAISFKLQAIFFLPVLFVLLLRRKLPMRYLVLIPAVFLLMLAPAFIAGRDAWSLLTIYAGQISSGGAGNGAGPGQLGGAGMGPFNGARPRPFNGAGQGPLGGTGMGPLGGTGMGPLGGTGMGPFNGSKPSTVSSLKSLTLNAPSFYQWLPTSAPEYWKWIGIALAAMFVIFIVVLVMKSKKELMPAIILKIALVFALAIPFLLPEMHERYFYLADVLSIIYAFYFPRYFYIAVITQLCSLLSYAPYLLKTEYVSLAYVAFGILLITAITVGDLVLTLYPTIRKRATVPSATFTNSVQDAAGFLHGEG